jgi:hypothetical protein
VAAYDPLDMGGFFFSSVWNYADTPDKGGWTGVFYPDKEIPPIQIFPLRKGKKEAIASYFMMKEEEKGVL